MGIPALTDLQDKVGKWAARNFPADTSRGRLRCALGVAEEAGELAHAVLKRDQGIRGDESAHIAAAKDAIGDIVVYLMDLCSREEWDFGEIVAYTVDHVTKRDWIADPMSGTEKA